MRVFALQSRNNEIIQKVVVSTMDFSSDLQQKGLLNGICELVLSIKGGVVFM